MGQSGYNLIALHFFIDQYILFKINEAPIVWSSINNIINSDIIKNDS